VETKGIEHLPSAAPKTPISKTSCAESGARNAPGCPREAGLSDVIEAWPNLPAGVREEILRVAGLDREKE